MLFRLSRPIVSLLLLAGVMMPLSLRAEHKDLAPLPDDVVKKMVDRAYERPTPALQTLQRHLKELKALAETDQGDQGEGQRMLLASKRQELKESRRDVLALIEEHRQKAVQENGAKAAGWWNDLEAKVKQRFDRLDRSLEPTSFAQKAWRKKAFETLRNDVKELHHEELAVLAPPPVWPTEPIPESLPVQLSSAKPAYEWQVPDNAGHRYAALGDPPATPADAAACNYNANDLAATPDVPKDDPEIKDLAKRLDYSPSRIYQYVYNNIKFEPYYGSMKGGLATLKTSAGGPTDQASLLIALLRASNIPARYIKGQVAVIDPSSNWTNGKVMRWLGAKSYTGAINMLLVGYFPGAAVYKRNDLTVGIEFTHVWVEACVPYGRYRGASLDKTGERWIPLDSSFRDRTYQPGIAHNQTFDYETFLSKRRDEYGIQALVQEAYADQVQAAVRQTAPNATIKDVPYTGQDKAAIFEYLPATLPYEVLGYVNWAGTSSPEIASLPDDHRYRVYINQVMGKKPAYNVALPDIALKKLSLGFNYTCFSNDSWNVCSACHSTYPVILLDGIAQTPSPDFWSFYGGAHNRDNSFTYYPLCKKDINTQVIVGLKERWNPSNTWGDTVGQIFAANYSNTAAKNLYSVGIYGYNIAQRILTDKAQETIKKIDNSGPYKPGTLEYLDLVGAKYAKYIRDAYKEIGALDGASGELGVFVGLTSTKAVHEYLFDLPFGIIGDGFLIDVKSSNKSVDLSSTNPPSKSQYLSAHAASLYESYVWQENARIDAISTVRGLQYANEKGIGTVTITKQNWDTVRPQLEVADSGIDDCAYVDSGLKYSKCQIDRPTAGPSNGFKSIKVLTEEGYEVTLPKHRIDYEEKGEWKGTLYRALGPGGAIFAIDSNGGGYTVGSPWASNSFSYLNQNTYRPLSTSLMPTFYNTNTIYNNAPLTRSAANGFSSLMTLSGDPVNMVSGNMYHNETDISLKGRGLPIVLTRGYNSRTPEDGPFGFGWTHSFNVYVKLYGVEDGKAKLSWMDGTGNERFFKTDQHTSGNITAGSTIPNPVGVFLTFKRESDGTFTIREKNGMVYKFASATGPAGTPGTSTTPVKAMLLSITDRNGNALTLGYTAATNCAGGNQLCQVSDQVGHSLKFEYTSNRITQVKDHTGRTYQYVYGDGKGNLTLFKNPMVLAGTQAQGTSYSYYTVTDGTKLEHLMKQYTLPRGNGMRFEYYVNGRVFRHTAVRRDGSLSPTEVNTFTYNDFRRESVQMTERGGEKHFFFDPYGNPVKVVEENGAEHHYGYDCVDPTKDAEKPEERANCPNPYNRLFEIDAAGYRTDYRYDDNGNVAKTIPPAGDTQARENFDFNTWGQPRRTKDALGRWTIQRYDAKGNLTDVIKTAAGYTPAACATAECDLPAASQIRQWIVNGYDSAGNLTSTKRVKNFASQLADNTPTSQTGPIFSKVYDANKLNVTTMSRIGVKNHDTAATTVNTATLVYDTLDRLKNGVDSDWHPVSFKYDPLDRVTEGTDKLGYQRKYTFDDNGNATGQTLEAPVNQVATQVDSSSTRYDDNDRAEVSMDAGGFATTFSYDPSGNLVSTTSPDNYTISYGYDFSKEPVVVYDQKGNAVSTNRDLSGRVRSVTDALGNATTYTYWDASRNGRLKRITQPTALANAVTAADKLLVPTFTSGRAVEYDYDAEGNVTSVTEVPATVSNPAVAGTNQALKITRTEYNDLNQATRTVGPQYTDATLGAVCPVTVYEYDTLGRRTAVSSGHTPTPCATAANDTVKLIQRFAFDDFGRRIKTTDALDRSWIYHYDAQNNMVSSKDPKNQITTFQWDTGHQLRSRTDQAGNTVTYTRNALGQVIKVAGPEVTYTYTYSNAHRLLSMTDSRGGKKLNYDWSPGGLLNGFTDGDGRKTRYVYDSVGRLAGITAPNGDTVAYWFDVSGRLIQRTMPNNVQTRWLYNQDNSVRYVLNYNALNTVISEHTYSYDTQGSRIRLSENIGGTANVYTYTYDELERLTKAQSTGFLESYTYDPVGNRLTKTAGTSSPVTTAYKYDNANQLQEIRLGSATGTLQATYTHDDNGNVISDGTRTYTWDALDQLQQVTTGGTTVAFGYDNNAQRIRKTVNGTVTNWLYDGQDVYAEYGAAWGNPNAVFTGGGATDDPIVRAVVTGASTYGQAKYYFADGLGSVVGLSNNTDTSRQTQRFDPWGNKLAGNIPQDAQYGYTGREPDETGLVYYRARYYNPAIGRFVSADPLGVDAGVNFYAYVNNAPMDHTDPDGMLPMSAMNRGLAGLTPTYYDRVTSSLGLGRNSLVTYQESPRTRGVARSAALGAAADFALGMIPGYDLVKAMLNPRATASDYAIGIVGLIPGGISRLAAAETKAASTLLRAEATVARTAINGCCCFPAGTPVLASTGPKPIEQIQVGDLVQARDPETGHTTLKPVTQLIHTEGKTLYRLTLRATDGTVSETDVTDNHPYWVTGRGWIDSAQLQAGMALDSFDKKALTVVSVRSLGRTEKTYNFTVADYHTYFAGTASAFVHNCSCLAKAKIGGESAAAAAGRRAHNNYGTALGNEFDTRVILPSGKKPDAVDWMNREVRELKPDNAKAMKRGMRQVEGYRKELEQMTGESWTSVVDVYRSGR